MRPRLLLVPGFSEIEWAIRPQLEEWAEVASFDPPGVGSEPPPPGGMVALTRAHVAARGLAEVDAHDWTEFVLLADSWGIGSAALIAAERPDAIAGVALGHALLEYRIEGESPTVNPGTHAAMSQLIAQDSPSFIRYGISQLTQGGYDEQLADEMVERFRAHGEGEQLRQVWEGLIDMEVEIGRVIGQLDCPILIAKHEGCLAFTDEGFEEAVEALPKARALSLDKTPSTSEEFAAAVRQIWG